MQINHVHIATAIVLGFTLVAVAIFFKLSVPSTNALEKNDNTKATSEKIDLKPEQIRRDDNANLYGNEEAEIVIVEFSDFECPFCARLHPTLKQIVDESNSKIVWEFRHLPLPMHENALIAAISSECVADHLGMDKFWDYTDILFENVGSNSPNFLKTSALELGLSLTEYESCIADEKIQERIVMDSEIARKLGGSGTPFSIIIKGEQMIPMVGALPYAEWQKKLAI